MSKSALRKLIRESGLPGDDARIDKELQEGSDHTAVLLSVSHLQHALERYVSGTFAADPEDLASVYEPGGLLASFHLTIQLAFALGLIDKVEREQLDRIRAIRNVFAHAMRPVGFHTDAIADEANKLPLPKELTDDGSTFSPRERFILSTWQVGTDLFDRSVKRSEAKLARLKAERDALKAKQGA